MNLVVDNLLALVEREGEEELALDLASFSCPINVEIQSFLLNRAIEFAKKKIAVTYLVIDENDGELLGFFT